jgi:two-component system sensor histidine kinase RpfC
VSDGNTVIEQFRNLRFDSLVLDMHMPGRTGLDVARAIRAIEKSRGAPRTPIVMLTAAASTDLQRSSIDAGVDLFLSKPVDPPALLRGVSQAFSDAGEVRAAPGARRDYVDRDMLRDMARLAADPRFLETFTGRFTREAKHLIDEIEGALARRDFARSRELAHSLKGAAVMSGAVRLGDSAARLEALSGADLGDAGAGALRDLRAILDATRAELSRVA